MGDHDPHPSRAPDVLARSFRAETLERARSYGERRDRVGRDHRAVRAPGRGEGLGGGLRAPAVPRAPGGRGGRRRRRRRHVLHLSRHLPLQARRRPRPRPRQHVRRPARPRGRAARARLARPARRPALRPRPVGRPRRRRGPRRAAADPRRPRPEHLRREPSAHGAAAADATREARLGEDRHRLARDPGGPGAAHPRPAPAAGAVRQPRPRSRSWHATSIARCTTSAPTWCGSWGRLARPASSSTSRARSPGCGCSTSRPAPRADLVAGPDGVRVTLGLVVDGRLRPASELMVFGTPAHTVAVVDDDVLTLAALEEPLPATSSRASTTPSPWWCPTPRPRHSPTTCAGCGGWCRCPPATTPCRCRPRSCRACGSRWRGALRPRPASSGRGPTVRATRSAPAGSGAADRLGGLRDLAAERSLLERHPERRHHRPRRRRRRHRQPRAARAAVVARPRRRRGRRARRARLPAGRGGPGHLLRAGRAAGRPAGHRLARPRRRDPGRRRAGAAPRRARGAHPRPRAPRHRERPLRLHRAARVPEAGRRRALGRRDPRATAAERDERLQLRHDDLGLLAQLADLGAVDDRLARVGRPGPGPARPRRAPAARARGRRHRRCAPTSSTASTGWRSCGSTASAACSPTTWASARRSRC